MIASQCSVPRRARLIENLSVSTRAAFRTLQTDAEIQNYLTECLVKVFHKHTFSLSFKNSLDRFKMDHDIKEFLETTGVSGWESVGKLTNAFNIYPQKSLPDWDAITMKS